MWVFLAVFLEENKNKKYSLYSTKEATPRKEYNKVIKSNSLSQITPLLNQN